MGVKRKVGWLTLLLTSSSAFAGPPYQTDDPEPVEYGHYELYVAFTQTRTRDDAAGNAPLVELNYGAAPNLHLGIGVVGAFDKPQQQASRYGFGDIELSLKYRFVQESEHTPMIAFFPSASLPTGNADRGLGNGASELFLPLWFQKNWGSWQINTGGGYRINHAAAAKNSWFFGWQIQKRLNEHLTLGGEMVHSTEETAGQGASTGFNLGGVLDVTEHHHLLISAGRGITNRDTNRFSSYVGYQLTW